MVILPKEESIASVSPCNGDSTIYKILEKKKMNVHIGSVELQSTVTLTLSLVIMTPPGCHHREQCCHTGCWLESSQVVAL
jgi:hypothetical protein